MKTNKRNHCVSVRMNSEELRRLNIVRGKIRCGTYLRLMFNESSPVSVPEINQQAYAELARSASNLNQIAHHLNSKGDIEVTQVLNALRDFRLMIIGVTQ